MRTAFAMSHINPLWKIKFQMVKMKSIIFYSHVSIKILFISKIVFFFIVRCIMKINWLMFCKTFRDFNNDSKPWQTTFPTPDTGNKLPAKTRNNHIMKKRCSLEHHPAFPGTTFMKNIFMKWANWNSMGNIQWGTSEILSACPWTLILKLVYVDKNPNCNFIAVLLSEKKATGYLSSQAANASSSEQQLADAPPLLVLPVLFD